jgi:hypothetical protein
MRRAHQAATGPLRQLLLAAGSPCAAPAGVASGTKLCASQAAAPAAGGGSCSADGKQGATGGSGRPRDTETGLPLSAPPPPELRDEVESVTM